MTFNRDRVRQLSKQCLSRLVTIPELLPSDPNKVSWDSPEMGSMTLEELTSAIEKTILAALDESWGEPVDGSMLSAACRLSWVQANDEISIARIDELFRAMSTVRRAALKEGM